MQCVIQQLISSDHEMRHEHESFWWSSYHHLVRSDQEFETGENKANFLKYKYNKQWTENHANHCKIQHFKDVNGHDLILWPRLDWSTGCWSCNDLNKSFRRKLKWIIYCLSWRHVDTNLWEKLGYSYGGLVCMQHCAAVSVWPGDHVPPPPVSHVGSR